VNGNSGPAERLLCGSKETLRLSRLCSDHPICPQLLEVTEIFQASSNWRPECGELQPITLRILPRRGCAMRASENGARSNQRTWWLVAAWAAFAVGQFYGQILHATGPRPSFEVATVKPSNSDNTTPSVSTATESRTMNVTARNLIEQAVWYPVDFWSQRARLGRTELDRQQPV
jgi:hypothetical protein